MFVECFDPALNFELEVNLDRDTIAEIHTEVALGCGVELEDAARRLEGQEAAGHCAMMSSMLAARGRRR